MLSSKNHLPPHVLFALDNVIRRVAEHLVGLIRPGKILPSLFFNHTNLRFIYPDFIPAVSSITPITPSDISSMSATNVRSPLFLGLSDGTTEEVARLHLQYMKLIQNNRE